MEIKVHEKTLGGIINEEKKSPDSVCHQFNPSLLSVWMHVLLFEHETAGSHKLTQSPPHEDNSPTPEMNWMAIRGNLCILYALKKIPCLAPNSRQDTVRNWPVNIPEYSAEKEELVRAHSFIMSHARK